MATTLSEDGTEYELREETVDGQCMIVAYITSCNNKTLEQAYRDQPYADFATVDENGRLTPVCANPLSYARLWAEDLVDQGKAEWVDPDHRTLRLI